MGGSEHSLFVTGPNKTKWNWALCCTEKKECKGTNKKKKKKKNGSDRPG